MKDSGGGMKAVQCVAILAVGVLAGCGMRTPIFSDLERAPWRGHVPLHLEGEGAGGTDLDGVVRGSGLSKIKAASTSW
ncbi:MAG: hypothetical protein IPL96_16575 [Holophagaceae bacterium]|nr:hypothetical protein [Holophagaceae bacterium]